MVWVFGIATAAVAIVEKKYNSDEKLDLGAIGMPQRCNRNVNNNLLFALLSFLRWQKSTELDGKTAHKKS